MTILNMVGSGPTPELPNYLCFTANTAGSTIKLQVGAGNPPSVTLETSPDGNSWTAYTVGDTITLANVGDKVYRRNSSTTDKSISSSQYNYHKFVMTGSIAGSGDINFLLNKNSTTSSDVMFSSLFNGCTALTTPPELPSTKLGSAAYSGMFSGCSSLTRMPELPATTLASYCYQYMFQNCTSLVYAIDKIPATTYKTYCMYSMFEGCTSLKKGPDLVGATMTSATYCCFQMFYKCSALEVAPSLPTTTLVNYCYGAMFRGCTSLKYPPELPATTLAESCYRQMFAGCTSLKVAPSLPATTLTGTGCYSYMFSDCSNLVTLPGLPATTLTNTCYSYMFQNCSKIKLSTSKTGVYQASYRIPVSGTGSTGTDSMKNMFTGTTGTRSGTPSINTTYYIATTNIVV